MSHQVQFETPENIEVSYQAAGLGTRFVAFFIDYMIMCLLTFVIVILFAIAGFSFQAVVQPLEKSFRDVKPGEMPSFPVYFMALAALIAWLKTLLYFGLSELIWSGQTIGKRQVGIRVVKADGFSLDAGSTIVRNLLRVVDHIPVMWVVPLVSQRSQRLGDLIGGTIVVSDTVDEIGDLRDILSRRSAAECKFRFDGTMLSRARPQDIEAVEQFIERMHGLGMSKRDQFLRTLAEALAERLQCPAPDPADRLVFLEDLLAAEYRRQYRRLG